MHLPPWIRRRAAPRRALARRAAAGLAATAVVVMASVGSCHMPQPKIPSLGLAAPTTAAPAVLRAGARPMAAIDGSRAPAGSRTVLRMLGSASGRRVTERTR